jgi:hypothetical protein
MTADGCCSGFSYPHAAPDLRDKPGSPTALNNVCDNGHPHMHQVPIGQTFSLASGQTCRLVPIRNDLIRNYYLLAFPIEQGQPSASEVTEMLNLGVGHAQTLAGQLLGDPDAFTILYSGYSARREKGWHVHIVLLGNRWRKAWLYAVLAGKNLAQAFGLRKDDAPRITHEP